MCDPDLQGKTNSIIARLRQSQLQPKKTSESIEPAVEITPSEPAIVPGTRDVSNQAVIDEPAEEKPEENIHPNGDPPENKSHAVFTSIGETLQQRRESLSLTLEEIEQHTHVRMHYLQALEQGDFDHLPSSVQTRGMLNNYARFLDMDVEAILLQFAEGLQIQRLERQPAPVEKRRISTAKISIQKRPTGRLTALPFHGCDRWRRSDPGPACLRYLGNQSHHWTTRLPPPHSRQPNPFPKSWLLQLKQAPPLPCLHINLAPIWLFPP